MIVQGSCALSSFRMQPGPTDRIDAAGALIAFVGMGVARSRLATNRIGNGMAICTRQSLEPTVCLWNATWALGECC